MPSPKPRIVVLDGYTLNPGDLSWAGLESLGDCSIFDRTLPEQIDERAVAAHIVLTNKSPLSRGTIASLADLEYIGVLATGYDIVDVDAARERSIPVTNVPSYGTRSVSQMVFAHVLNLTQHVGQHAAGVRKNRWSEASDWCFWDFPLYELDGLTMGVVGMGRIGRATAEIARAFGMDVLAHNSRPLPATEDFRTVDLQTLFRESDIVSLHCPLTPETRHIVNQETLALMKSTAFLINTSRGPLVDETALAAALNEGQLAGAGLDVLSVEPPPADHQLFLAKNCYITPHIAWATQSSRRRLLGAAVENVAAFLRGGLVNVVNAS